MSETHKIETFSDAETAAPADSALKLMLATPPKLHKDSKIESQESRLK